MYYNFLEILKTQKSFYSIILSQKKFLMRIAYFISIYLFNKRKLFITFKHSIFIMIVKVVQ